MTEELDVLQRPKCENQDVYTISVGASPPGSTANVKLVEVDYKNGGKDALMSLPSITVMEMGNGTGAGKR